VTFLFLAKYSSCAECTIRYKTKTTFCRMIQVSINRNRLTAFLLFATFSVLPNVEAIAQCQPAIRIDGNRVNLGVDEAASAIAFPFWLKDGQTLSADQLVHSISVLEFTQNDSNLEFSQVVSVTSEQTVPEGKVWKVESAARNRSIVDQAGGMTYTSPGTHSFTVPLCVDFICVEAWGGGGGGASGANYNGGGGGAGGYGRECFSVTPGSTHSLTVGNGGKSGNGGASSFGSFVSASAGTGSVNSTTGGTGGTSAAAFSITGSNGTNGSGNQGGDGGSSGNGGRGGVGGNPGQPGAFPGGGGGGGGYAQSTVWGGGSGAPGQVKISW